jgi:hypothetical protein
MGDRWTYPPEFLETLARLGLAPRADTPPSVVRNAVDELYKIELRRLRGRYLRGEIAKADLAAQVIGLRQKYWLLTLPASAWERICRAME